MHAHFSFSPYNDEKLLAIEARNMSSLLHVLSSAMQNIPVVPDPVHAALPQMQGASSSALLGADPSVILQAGAVRVQMHV